MTFDRYFLVELVLEDGNKIRIASDGQNLRIRGRPYEPIEIRNLWYNRTGDKTTTVHRTRLVKDI
jgi:hypothetical protein